jgi:putative zinc finger/helix-turn-helix YgiT family protein
MHPNRSKQAKRPFGAERPFPWRCRHCGKDEVIMTTTCYAAEVRHDGRLYTFTIPHLDIPVCQACGEKVFTEQVDDQINATLRSHLRLLTPDQIRAALDRIGMMQKEAADRLGIAEATLSRWLTETQIQSRAMDNLLRVFFALPEVRAVLQGTHQDPNLGTKDTGDLGPGASDPPGPGINRIRKHFPHVRDAEAARSRARAFQLAPAA